MASLLSALSRPCSLYLHFTWCRKLYLRERIKDFSRLCSSYDQAKFNGIAEGHDDTKKSPKTKFDRIRRDQFQNNYKEQRNSVHAKQFPRKTSNRKMEKFGERLYKERDISDEDREAEIEDAAVLENLPESDRFGFGVGDFKETTDEKSSSKPWKQTALPRNWSNTFGTMHGTEDEFNLEKSALIKNEKHWEDLQKQEEKTEFHNHIRLARYNRRHVPHYYARKIIKLGKKGQIRGAIEVFDKWMIEQDRVKPTVYEFAILIKLLAEVGYTVKAFQLYKQMLGMKIYCDDQIYSSLFNACANSPWPENGLKMADQLHRSMLVKGVYPNYITYLAMIKAYGMNGEINTAFKLADEAIELHCDDHLLSNLLIACISDKEAGFRHAVVVWRKFRKLGVKPTLHCYNLLLRAVKECGIGDPKLVNKLLGGRGKEDMHVIERKRCEALEPVKNRIKNDNEISSDSEEDNRIEHSEVLEDAVEAYKKSEKDDITENRARMKVRKSIRSFQEIDKLLKKYEIMSGENQADDFDELGVSEETTGAGSRALAIRKEWWELDVFENSVNAVQSHNSVEVIADNAINLPNILDPDENFSSVIHVEAVQYKEDRLALLGGMYGFLRTLEEENIKPDIITYTQLAQVAPGFQEDMLIDEMYANGMKPDIDFYNLLIRKRTKHNKKGAWELYNRLKREEFKPDIKTFSCMALVCKHMKDGLTLIQHMMTEDIVPNDYTLNSLIISSENNFAYKIEILRKMQELGVNPNKHTIEIIEKQISNAKESLVAMEKNALQSSEQKNKAKRFRWNLQHFLDFYDTWAQYNILDKKPHPWKHFMEQKEEN